MADNFATLAVGLSSPYTKAEAVTLSTTARVTLTDTSRGFICGTTGTLLVTMLSGSTASFIYPVAGAVFPIRATAVSGDSTATGILSLS